MSLPLIAYVRVSRRGDKEDGKFRSPDQQETRARKFATDNGFEVGRVIPDINVSGGIHPTERPGMAEALREIADGRAGGIVAFDMSRLSREPSHLEWLAAEMALHGAALIWPGMPVDPHSATGELQIGVLAQFDRYTRKQAGERFKLAVDNATRLGIPHGPIPFGYRQLEDRTILPDPDTAPLVREVFERRIGGEGWGAMALWFTGETGHPWSRRGLSHVVANPLYRTGRLVAGGVESDVLSGAIVDDATWFAAQSPKLVRDGRTAKGKWLLTGLLRCGTCGHALNPWTPQKSRKGGTAYRYRCQNVHCTAKVTVHGPVAEDLVVREAFALSRKLVSKPTGKVNLAPLESALARAERRFEQVQAPEAQDALGDAWPSTAKLRREERDAAAAALGAARAEAGVDDGGQTFQLSHLWDDLDPTQQREALQWAFSEVRVAKVPPMAPPKLTFVAQAARPFRIDFRPPGLIRL